MHHRALSCQHRFQEPDCLGPEWIREESEIMVRTNHGTSLCL